MVCLDLRVFEGFEPPDRLLLGVIMSAENCAFSLLDGLPPSLGLSYPITCRSWSDMLRVGAVGSLLWSSSLDMKSWVVVCCWAALLFWDRSSYCFFRSRSIDCSSMVAVFLARAAVSWKTRVLGS